MAYDFLVYNIFSNDNGMQPKQKNFQNMEVIGDTIPYIILYCILYESIKNLQFSIINLYFLSKITFCMNFGTPKWKHDNRNNSSFGFDIEHIRDRRLE